MKRWHQFSNGLSTEYGHGTADQAQRHLVRLNAPRAVNHYAATELDEGEQPIVGAVIVDLVSGSALPDRYGSEDIQG